MREPSSWIRTTHPRILSWCAYTYEGDVDRALAAFDRAMQLEPYTLAIRAARALTLFHARRYDESIASLHQILALDERFGLARSFLMRVLLAKDETCSKFRPTVRRSSLLRALAQR